MKFLNELTDRNKNLPQGLLRALEQNKEAMQVFDSMPDILRDRCIRKAKNARSRAEMDAVVSELASKTFKDFVRAGSDGR